MWESAKPLGHLSTLNYPILTQPNLTSSVVTGCLNPCGGQDHLSNVIETDKILSNFITAEEGRISCTAEYCLAACGDREGVRYGTLARPRRQYHARGKRVTLIPKCFYMRDHFQITRNDIRCQDCRVMRIAKSSCARVHEWRLVALFPCDQRRRSY